MPMTPLERWLAVLRRERPDRVPMDYWGTNEFTCQLMTHLGCSSKRETLEKLHVDFVVKPKAVYVGRPRPRGVDPFGCRHAFIGNEAGVYEECVFHPLAEFSTPEEIEEKYEWPSPDWWDYTTIAGQVEGFGEYPVQGGGSEPFLIYKNLRGPEQSFVDLVENPGLAHYILDKLFDLAYQDTIRVFESIPGRVNLCYIAEDLGDQADLMISPRHIREFLLPGMRRMVALAHQGGAFVFHHDDGSIRRILPDLVDLGIDVLNPIQWRCPGMERVALKRDFGEAVVFHGGMDNQITLPFGSEEDVRMEVRLNLRMLGKGGGYILAPCHNLQGNTPVENVVAMYETGYEEGQVF